MNSAESAIAFACGDDALVGIVHRGAAEARTGVLIVVGGPQYRVGSHRQFVLLARGLAAQGLPVMRFDYRGMGDASGRLLTFEEVNQDIACALDEFCARVPGLRSVVIWGLCDAASAALFYAHRDARVGGLVLLNPWVRTEAGRAKAYMKHYYLQRAFSLEFWKKAVTGKWKPGTALKGFMELAGKLRTASQPEAPADRSASAALPLPERMAQGWDKFKGPILLILSGNNDYVADEFRDLAGASRDWQRRVTRGNLTRQDFPAANHTFSRGDWRAQVEQWTGQWIHEHFPS